VWYSSLYRFSCCLIGCYRRTSSTVQIHVAANAERSDEDYRPVTGRKSVGVGKQRDRRGNEGELQDIFDLNRTVSLCRIFSLV